MAHLIQVLHNECVVRSDRDRLRIGQWLALAILSHVATVPGNLLAMRNGDLCYLDFGMMSEAPQSARYVRPVPPAPCITPPTSPHLLQSIAQLQSVGTPF